MRWKLGTLRWLASVLVCWMLSGSVLAASPRFAVCLLRVEDRVLLVQDRLSGRYGLPGGYVDTGETADVAALRELYEETGLRGEITADLGPLGDGYAYACRTTSPIDWVASSGDINLLAAPDRGREIIRARLADQTLLRSLPPRFSAETGWLQQWTQIADSPARRVPNFVASASALHQAEWPWLVRWQALGRPLAPLWAFTNLLGSLPLLMLLWIWRPARWSTTTSRALLHLTAAGLLCSEGLKALWHSPRPFQIDPALAWHTAASYGLPSTHALLATLVWGSIFAQAGLHGARWLGGQRWLGGTLLVALLIGMTRTVYGVHFFSDVLPGALLGLGGAWLLTRPAWPVRLAGRWTPRGLTVLAGVAALLTQSQDLAYLAAALGGLQLGYGLPWPSRPLLRPVTSTSWQRIGYSLLLGVLAMLWWYGERAGWPGSITQLLGQGLLWGLAGGLLGHHSKQSMSSAA